MLLIVNLGDIGATQKFLYAELPIFERSSIFHAGSSLQNIYGGLCWTVRKTFAIAVNLVRHQRVGKRKAPDVLSTSCDPHSKWVHGSEGPVAAKPGLHTAVR